MPVAPCRNLTKTDSYVILALGDQKATVGLLAEALRLVDQYPGEKALAECISKLENLEILTIVKSPTEFERRPLYLNPLGMLVFRILRGML